jgi:hypothetical protein
MLLRRGLRWHDLEGREDLQCRMSEKSVLRAIPSAANMSARITERLSNEDVACDNVDINMYGLSRYLRSLSIDPRAREADDVRRGDERVPAGFGNALPSPPYPDKRIRARSVGGRP